MRGGERETVYVRQKHDMFDKAFGVFMYRQREFNCQVKQFITKKTQLLLRDCATFVSFLTRNTLDRDRQIYTITVDDEKL